MKKLLYFIPDHPEYVRMVNSGAGFLPDYASSEEFKSGKSVNDSEPHVDLWGVFADDMPQNIVTRVYNYHLSAVVLAGEESPLMIENLRATLIPDIQPDIQIIKQATIRTSSDVERLKEYEPVVDGFRLLMEADVDVNSLSKPCFE